MQGTGASSVVDVGINARPSQERSSVQEEFGGGTRVNSDLDHRNLGLLKLQFLYGIRGGP